MLQRILNWFRGPKGDPGEPAPAHVFAHDDRYARQGHGHANYIVEPELDQGIKDAIANLPATIDPEHGHTQYSKNGHKHENKTLARKGHNHPELVNQEQWEGQEEWAATHDHPHDHDGDAITPKLIRVPVNLVLTYADTANFTGRPDIEDAIKFFLRQGIDLRVSLHTKSLDPSDLTYAGKGMYWHMETAHNGLTGYIGMDAETVGPAEKNWVGLAANKSNILYGTFLVAGASQSRHGTVQIKDTLIHELGHVFLGSDHRPGTFMDAVISSSDRVDPDQLLAMQAGARDWGY